MDRLPRKFLACSLGLLLVAPGCKMTRPEVPPGRPYANDGRQRKAIEFSSEGHPVNGAATANIQPNTTGPGAQGLASGIEAGISRPDASAYGAPGGSYGPPGTSGLNRSAGPGEMRTADPETAPAAMPPPAGLPPTSPAFAPTPNIPPSRDPELQAPSQVIQAPTEPGKMAAPDQMPSPF